MADLLSELGEDEIRTNLQIYYIKGLRTSKLWKKRSKDRSGDLFPRKVLNIWTFEKLHKLMHSLATMIDKAA